METVEYQGFAGQAPKRLRHLAVTWRWPLLLSLLLHAIVFWPAVPTVTPVVLAIRPALSGHLQAPASPDLPQIASPEVAVAHHRSVTKTTPVKSPAAPPLSRREDVVSASSATMQVTSVAADAGGLRSYRVALARSLESGGWRNGLSPQVRGTLEVGIAIDASGRVQEIGLVRGSGQAALDRHLLDAVRLAVREAAIPPTLQSQAFVVTLPIEVGEATLAADR